MTTVTHMDFTVHGPPVGKARPRFNRRQGRTYTPAETENAEANIRAAWAAAGSPRLPDGPITLTIEVHVTRPKSHYRVNGLLSAVGRRNVLPTSRPDLDNIAKLVQDALNGLAWRDDAQVANLIVERWYAASPLVRVTAWDTLNDAPYLVEAAAAEEAARAGEDAA